MEHPDNIQEWTPVTIKRKSKNIKSSSYISKDIKLDTEEYVAPFSLTNEQKNEIIALRSMKGLTRKELANKMSISENEINKIENNRLPNKSLYHRVKEYLKK